MSKLITSSRQRPRDAILIKHEQDLDIDLGLDVLGNLDIDLVSKSILYQYKTKIRKENLRKKI